MNDQVKLDALLKKILIAIFTMALTFIGIAEAIDITKPDMIQSQEQK